MRYCLFLLFLSFTPFSVSSRPVKRSLVDQLEFCRDDYVVASESPSRKMILSCQRENGSKALHLKGVDGKDKKVTRAELLRFQLHDSGSEFPQWIIRTWNGGHVAVDNEGNLVVENECLATTFLRYVEKDDLLDCFNGENCMMMLCATQISTKENFLVSLNNKSKPLPPGSCSTYNALKQALNDIKSQENLRDLDHYRFNFVPLLKVSEVLSKGLKFLCPSHFDLNSVTSSKSRRKVDCPASRKTL